MYPFLGCRFFLISCTFYAMEDYQTMMRNVQRCNRIRYSPNNSFYHIMIIFIVLKILLGIWKNFHYKVHNIITKIFNNPFLTAYFHCLYLHIFQYRPSWKFHDRWCLRPYCWYYALLPVFMIWIELKDSVESSKTSEENKLLISPPKTLLLYSSCFSIFCYSRSTINNVS